LKPVPNKTAKSRTRSVSIEEVPDEDDLIPRNSPRNPQSILEDVSDDEDAPAPSAGDGEPEVLEESEEDDEAELSEYLLYMYDKQLLTNSVLARMSKKWTSPVYVFFKPTPDIKYKDGRRCHVFECAAGSCKGKNSRYVSRFLDGDNIEGWVDERAAMSKEEVDELDESVAPVWLLLTKGK
jgi:hypothetical protein